MLGFPNMKAAKYAFYTKAKVRTGMLVCPFTVDKH